MSEDVKRLYRSRNERMLAGVCGGLGEYLGVDPTLVRLILVLLIILSGIGPGVLAYIILWLIVPLDKSEKTMELNGAESG
jgi:phage shock protein C